MSAWLWLSAIRRDVVDAWRMFSTALGAADDAARAPVIATSARVVTAVVRLNSPV